MRRPDADAGPGHTDAGRDPGAVRRVTGPVRRSVARRIPGRIPRRVPGNIAGRQHRSGVELSATSASRSERHEA